MIRKSLALLGPAALLALPLALPAAAADGDSWTYQADMKQLNNSGASGSFMVKLDGNEATITGNVTGLATTFQDNPYPHVQHIHIAAQGKCPTPSADTNGDGIVDTVEGQPAYGKVGTTLSVKGETGAGAATNVKTAPSGGSYEYSRTFTLNADTVKSLKSGTGVVVVHGLDPSGLSDQAKNAKSNLAPKLPLAATSPAACGTLTASQMEEMPSGSVDTGGGSTSGVEAPWMIGLGGAALLAAGGTAVARRRLSGSQQ